MGALYPSVLPKQEHILWDVSFRYQLRCIVSVGCEGGDWAVRLNDTPLAGLLGVLVGSESIYTYATSVFPI